MSRLALIGLVVTGWALARPDAVRYLRWPDVQPLLAALAAAGEKIPGLSDSAAWENWIRERDAEVRARMDRGFEDSISALVIFGTSFTTQKKLGSAAEAVNAAGDLTPSARMRLDGFLLAIDQQDNERFSLVVEFLRRRRVTQEELRAFLSGNLRRFAIEQAGLRKNSQGATLTDAGLSFGTTLLINFAVEDTLRNLKSKGVLPARIRRIAAVGPGLDFAGQPDGCDFYPPQSAQSLALLEAVLRLGLAQASAVQMTAFDLNPLVLSHLRTSSARARAGRPYVLQLARPASAAWNAGAVTYWQHFGDLIGSPATSATAPPGFELRVVAVKAQFAARVSVEDLNVVAQTLETPAGQEFDLVVATDVLGYYSRLEQALAMTSIAKMTARGGIVLANGLLPGAGLQEFEDLGAHHVSFADGKAGGDVGAYRRK